jgi:hypothetical protein
VEEVRLFLTMQKTLDMQKPPGFIALISILIISAVLLAAVASVAYSGVASRFMLLDLEYKARSEQHAEACVAVGTLAVINDPLYSASDLLVPVGAGECLLSVTPAGGSSQIEAMASSSGATTNLRVTIDSGTGAVLLWREVPTL